MSDPHVVEPALDWPTADTGGFSPCARPALEADRRRQTEPPRQLALFGACVAASPVKLSPVAPQREVAGSPRERFEVNAPALRFRRSLAPGQLSLFADAVMQPGVEADHPFDFEESTSRATRVTS